MEDPVGGGDGGAALTPVACRPVCQCVMHMVMHMVMHAHPALRTRPYQSSPTSDAVTSEQLCCFKLLPLLLDAADRECNTLYWTDGCRCVDLATGGFSAC